MDFGIETTDETDMEWVNLRTIMAETRSDEEPYTGSASFEFNRVVHNNDAGSQGGEVITLMNDTGQACAVWVTQHPDAQFPVDDDKTDGARLGRALARAFGGETNDQVFGNANALGGTLNVTQVQYGEDQTRWAWLWTVTPNKG